MQDFDVKDDECFKKIVLLFLMYFSLDKIIELLANLDSFPEEKEIIIEFNNLEFKARENDVAEFFLGNHQPYKLLQNQVFVKNKLLFTIEIDKYLDEEKNRYLKNGKGRIITDDRKFAKLCAELHGSVKIYLIHLLILLFRNFLIDLYIFQFLVIVRIQI